MTSKKVKIEKIKKLKLDLINCDFDELDTAETDFFNNEDFLSTISHKGLDMYLDMLNECMEQTEFGSNIKECNSCGDLIVKGYVYEDEDTYYCNQSCAIVDMGKEDFAYLKSRNEIKYYKFG